MKKPNANAISRRLAPFLRGIPVVAMMVCSVLHGQTSGGEPESRGHPLSYWLARCRPGGNAEERKVAEAAIPELAEIANDARHRRPAARAMMALRAIGPEALPAVEARLANPDFPPGTAVSLYLETRTGADHHRLGQAEATAILRELQANANPQLAKGASQLLQMMDQPSFWARGQTKSISEALSDLRMEQRGMGREPGGDIPAWAKLSADEQRAASNAVQAALNAPPARPKGDEPYPYPLQIGTAAWDYAEAGERVRSVEIPKSWREQATSWQLFRSAIGNPYFKGIFMLGEDIGRCYGASRSSLVSILQEVDTSPDFGTNVLRWLSELDLARMAAADWDKPYEPCSPDYLVVWHMAGMDSALQTLDVASRQKLYRLAVWDADYFLSRSNNIVACGPVGFVCAFGSKPESFRGFLPSQAIVSPAAPGKSGPLDLSDGFIADPESVRSTVAAAKAALKIKKRP
jgi:hypothetical protein